MQHLDDAKVLVAAIGHKRLGSSALMLSVEDAVFHSVSIAPSFFSLHDQ